MSRGWVYVLDNPSIPGKVKIGFTERIPDVRMNELDATGVPTPFDLQFSALVDRAFELEQEVHTSLDSSRVRQNREWFDLAVGEAIEAIRSSARKMGLPLLFEDDRFSDSQASSETAKRAGERYIMIATAAYAHAEQRGFSGCYEMEDWIAAEAQIDAKLKG